VLTGDIRARSEERLLLGDQYARRHPDALFALQCLLVIARNWVRGQGPTVEDLRERLASVDVAASAQAFPSVPAAYRHAQESARADDRILVFGSFHTVGEVLALVKPD
jgi:folylpolyglutamate synthase/dihydropteroate synthase